MKNMMQLNSKQWFNRYANHEGEKVSSKMKVRISKYKTQMFETIV